MKNQDLLKDAISLLNDNKNAPEAQKLIRQFILSNELAPRTKFNPYDFTNPKATPYNPQQSGVYFSEGFKVATNGYVLIAYKEDYAPELEGKTIDKKGAEITDGTYPNYRCVIPADKGLEFVKIDYKKVLEIEREYNLDKKTKDLEIGAVVIKGVGFSVPFLAKMARFALNFGITTIGLSTPDCAGKITDGVNMGIIMPIMLADINEEIQGRKIYKL